jgi:hypothetical protein
LGIWVNAGALSQHSVVHIRMNMNTRKHSEHLGTSQLLQSVVVRGAMYDVAGSRTPRTGRHTSWYPLSRMPLLRPAIVIKLKSTSASRKSEVVNIGITTFWISIVLNVGPSRGCGALRTGVLTLSWGLVAPLCAYSAFQHGRWLKQNLGLFTPDDG